MDQHCNDIISQNHTILQKKNSKIVGTFRSNTEVTSAIVWLDNKHTWAR